MDIANTFQDSSNKKLVSSNVGKSVSRDKAFRTPSHELLKKRSPPLVQPNGEVALAAGIETVAVLRKTPSQKPAQIQTSANATADIIYFNPNTPVVLNKVALALVEFTLLGLFGIDRCVAGETDIGIVKGLVFGITIALSSVGQYIG